MKRLIFLALLGIAGAYFFRAYCYEGIYIASESMEPTYHKGLHVMVKKYPFLFRSPRRGEVVMLESPVDPSKGLVKRVIAVGGDTIEIRQKKVYVNGSAVEEPYVQFVKPDTLFLGDDIPPTKVPDATVFVMGDNRDVSGDSRDWKTPAGDPAPFLPLSNVKGLVN
jgi:signal peptidase I